MRKNIVAGLMVLMLAPLTPAFAGTTWFSDQVKSLKNGTLTQAKLSDTKIGEGLKEALKVGVKNAIQKTGKVDGYFKNDSIKIIFPENLKTAEKTLRALGMGKPLDEFVLSMNRSAEKAVPLASDIFLDAIFQMSIDDAQKILKGPDTAATGFLKDKAYPGLKKAFQPIIKKTLAENGVTKKYNDLLGRYNALPLAKKLPLFDPEEYVLNKGLEGLFLVLGEEEAKIRKDPAARVTDLLRQVFK